jgi:hypothetical protein
VESRIGGPNTTRYENDVADEESGRIDVDVTQNQGDEAK